MVVPWEGLGLLLAALIAGLTKSCYNGRLKDTIRGALSKQQSAKTAHDAIPEVKQTVEDINEKVDYMNESLDDLHFTVAYLHRHDLEEEPLARERLDVDSDSDILQDD